MNQTVIVTGGTKNDFIPIGVLAVNIKNTNPDLADKLIIYHDGIPWSQQNIIKKIFPTEFLRYKFPGKLESNSYIHNYFSEMIFCKYECLKLLNLYNKVIWTDYDVVIIKELSEIKKSISPITFTDDPTHKAKHHFIENTHLDLININPDRDTITTPIFIFNKSIHNYNKLYHFCIKNTIEHSKLLYLPEQAVFEMMIQHFNLEYLTIPTNEYAVHPEKDNVNENTKILHSYGQPKFWNGINNSYWNKYYKEWLLYGGLSFEQFHKRNNFIKKYKKYIRKIKSIFINLWRKK